MAGVDKPGPSHASRNDQIYTLLEAVVCFFYWPTCLFPACFHHMPRAERKEPICALSSSSKHTQRNTPSQPRRATAGLARGYRGAAARRRSQRHHRCPPARGRCCAVALEEHPGHCLRTGVQGTGKPRGRVRAQAGAPAHTAPRGSKYSETTAGVFEKS